MRKLSFLFAFILSVMGVTQAWAVSYSADDIKNSWTVSDPGRWTYGYGGMYEYYPTEMTTVSYLTSPTINASKRGVRVTVNGYGGQISKDGASNTLKYEYSVDGVNWIEIADITKDLVYNAKQTAHDMTATFAFDEAVESYRLRITCKNIFLTSVTIDEFDVKTVYLQPNYWDSPDYVERYALYFGYDDSNYWTDFTLAPNETDIYKAIVPANSSLIIPCRFFVKDVAYNSNLSCNGWDDRQDQTADITSFEDNIMFTMTSYGNQSSYTTSTYSPLITYTATFTNNLGWEHVYAYAWSGDGANAVQFLGDYPGTEVTEKDGNVYTLTFSARAVPEKIIFSESQDGEKTLDLAFENEGAYQTPGRKTIYLKPNSNWLQANARFAMYMFDDALNINRWNNFVAVPGKEGIYASTVLDYYTGIILCRMNPETTDNNFDNKWNQTSNITGFEDKDLFTINEEENNWTEYTKGTFTMTLALDEASTENQIVAGTYDEVTIARTVLAGPNPMCLPFAVTKEAFEANFGEGSTVLEFGAYENGAINLTKKEIADVAMEANVPYIVYAKQAATELSFNNVEVNANAAGTVTQGEAQFIGTFVKKALIAEGDNKPYAVSKTGTINPVKAGANLKGFRAYFMLPANTTAKVFIDGVAVDGEATGIEAIEDAQEGVLYDLSGRRVNNAQKGIYIQNGKKVVVK